MQRILPGLIFAAAICASGAHGAEEPPDGGGTDDKSRYTLFNPVPENMLRDFNPDRPGLSHDPTTIDAGHVQIENGGAEHIWDPRGPSATTTRRWIYAAPTVRVGILNWLEVQAGVPLYNLLRTSGDEQARASGYGDTNVGVKINLLGNDSGDHLLAILPNMKVPTAAGGLGNGRAEYFLSVPYNYKLTPDLLLTIEPSAAALRNDANTRYRDSYGLILGFDQTIAKVFVASIEVQTQVSSYRKAATTWALSPSLAYLATKNLQFDAGIVFGLNKAIPRYDPYVGVSMRF